MFSQIISDYAGAYLILHCSAYVSNLSSLVKLSTIIVLK